MTTLGYSLLILAAISLLVSSFRRAEWLMGFDAIVCFIGVVLTVAMWYKAHYMPTPYGAGILMKYDSDTELELQLEVLLLSLVWSAPLIGYGAGTWLRQKIAQIRTPGVSSSF